jgi:hypothetical protein
MQLPEPYMYIPSFTPFRLSFLPSYMWNLFLWVMGPVLLSQLAHTIRSVGTVNKWNISVRKIFSASDNISVQYMA